MSKFGLIHESASKRGRSQTSQSLEQQLQRLQQQQQQQQQPQLQQSYDPLSCQADADFGLSLPLSASHPQLGSTSDLASFFLDAPSSPCLNLTPTPSMSMSAGSASMTHHHTSTLPRTDQSCPQDVPLSALDLMSLDDVLQGLPLSAAGDGGEEDTSVSLSHPVAVISSHPQSPGSSVAEKSNKVCSVCRQVKGKVGHRLQVCERRDHSECQLVCNSCEDFFRRHTIHQKQRATCGSEAACTGKTLCQSHRYQRCLDVGMRQRDVVRARDLAEESAVAAAAAAAVSPLPMPVEEHHLPEWHCAVNRFSDRQSRLQAFCDSLNLNIEKIQQKFASVEEVMKQTTEYSTLLIHYSSEEAQAIRHECLSIQMLLECFFTYVESGFTERDLAEMRGMNVMGVPVCVGTSYVTQKKLQVGRDMVPPLVDMNKVPMHPLAYEKYRGAVPRQVFVIERRESTTTPPFAVGSPRAATKQINFFVTSKIQNNSTVLYLRRKDEKAIHPLQVDVAVKIEDGDTLSIYNERSSTAELIAWRVSMPRPAPPPSS